MTITKALVLAALMWELGYVACLALNKKRLNEPLTKIEAIVIVPVAVASLVIETLVVSGILTNLIMHK